MTVSAMVFGEPPGYWPLTTTVGGTISGYSLIGSTGIASSPATVITIASTVAKIGRSMKNEEIYTAEPEKKTRRREKEKKHTRGGPSLSPRAQRGCPPGPPPGPPPRAPRPGG